MATERIRRLDIKMKQSDFEVLALLARRSGLSRQKLVAAALENAVREMAIAQLIETIRLRYDCVCRVSTPTQVEFRNTHDPEKAKQALAEFNHIAQVLGDVEGEAYHNRLKALVALGHDDTWDRVGKAFEVVDQQATEA